MTILLLLLYSELNPNEDKDCFENFEIQGKDDTLMIH